MIMIANHCDSTGKNAFPSIDTLARETRMNRRTVQRLLDLIEQSGEITVDRTPGRTNSIQINMEGVQNTTPLDDQVGGDNLSPPTEEGGVTSCHGGRDKAMSPPGVTRLCHPKGPLKGPLTTDSAPRLFEEPKPAEVKDGKLTKLDQFWNPPPERVKAAKNKFIGEIYMDIDDLTKKFKERAWSKGIKSFCWEQTWYDWIIDSYTNYYVKGWTNPYKVKEPTTTMSLEQKCELYCRGDYKLTTEEKKYAVQTGLLIM